VDGGVLSPADYEECHEHGKELWIEPFSPLRPERWEGTSMFLYRRKGRLGWAAVDRRCPVCGTLNQCNARLLPFMYGSAGYGKTIKERGALLIDLFQFCEPLQSGAIDIRNEDDAVWWLSEYLRAHFAVLVHETGRPLGRAFFGEEGALPCFAKPEESSLSVSAGVGDRAPTRVVSGKPPTAERVKWGWRVTFEEWRCEDRAIYRWTFMLPDDGFTTEKSHLRFSKVRSAPSCECR
jgi:hypothetical protein